MTALVRQSLTNYHPFPARCPAVESPRGFWPRLGQVLRLWQSRLRERSELATLNAHDLRDIGVSPGEVWDELRQPFWRSTLRR